MKNGAAWGVLARREPLGISLLENKQLFYLHAISMPQTRWMAKASIYEGLAGLGQIMIGLCSRPMVHFGSKCSIWGRCVMA
jgi:hypothetical protein